ncbi:MAG: CHRD domain-containing protein, partial [Actinomycetota bacterium]|nr:CHRD domain-containing protein [Actinomycetota bacterium]
MIDPHNEEDHMSVSTKMKLSAAGAASIAVLAGGGSATAQDEEVPEPSSFTSAFTAAATPDEIVDPEGMAVAGEEGAMGTFNFRINSDEEIICYDITLNGVTPPYMSMARSATHIHEAVAGVSGPPRVTFPDPVDAGDGTLRSSGCVQGPFTTGIEAEGGGDTGDGFSLKEIEDDPAEYYGDTHTMDFVAGA